MLRYLYCAIPADRAPDVSAWRGEGAPLEVVTVDGVAGVVGSVPRERYGARALERAMADVRELAPYAVAHQSVVQYVFERAPAVVPLAFGSVHRSRGDAARALAGETRRLARLLRRLAGMEEWGLRVVWKREAPHVDPSAPGAGTAYLRAKRTTLRSRAPDPAARRAAERLAARLERLAASVRASRPRQGDLVLRAAYLVPKARVPKLHAALLAATAELQRHGLVAELSGPWPAYSFASR